MNEDKPGRDCDNTRPMVKRSYGTCCHSDGCDYISFIFDGFR